MLNWSRYLLKWKNTYFISICITLIFNTNLLCKWSKCKEGTKIGLGTVAGAGGIAVCAGSGALVGAGTGAVVGAGVGAGTGAVMDHNDEKNRELP